MPEETMVASWRVMIVSSAALTRFGRSLSSIFMPDFFSSRRMTWRPLVLSSAITAASLTPVMTPSWGRPAASTPR